MQTNCVISAVKLDRRASNTSSICKWL